MASVLYVANTTNQAVLDGGLVDLGSTIRKNCCSQAELNGNGINIEGVGYFVVDVNATYTNVAAGDIVLQLYQDGVPVPGAIATITSDSATAILPLSFTAEIKTSCCHPFTTLTLVNTGVAATITNIAVRVKRDA